MVVCSRKKLKGLGWEAVSVSWAGGLKTQRTAFTKSSADQAAAALRAAWMLQGSAAFFSPTCDMYRYMPTSTKFISIGHTPSDFWLWWHRWLRQRQTGCCWCRWRRSRGSTPPCWGTCSFRRIEPWCSRFHPGTCWDLQGGHTNTGMSHKAAVRLHLHNLSSLLPHWGGASTVSCKAFWKSWN